MTSFTKSPLSFSYFFMALVACNFWAATVFAQTPSNVQPVFYVQLGLLRYPDTLQFAPLRPEGKIYQELTTDNKTRILIGKYADRKTAMQRAETIKQKGFAGVFIVQRAEEVLVQNLISATANEESTAPPLVAASPAPTEKEESGELKLFSIQLGAFKAQAKIPNTRHVEHYGKIILVQEGAYTKLRLGVFKKEEDALAVLNRVKAYGFPEAGLFVLQGLTSSPREGFIPTTEATALQAASYYKRMQGKINGSQAVVVHLYYTENSFAGYYTDPTTAERKKFIQYGVNLNDKTQPQQGGVYITRFGGDSFGLNFGIKDKETGKETVFALNEQYQKGSANFDVVTLYRKKIKKVTHGEIGADVFVEYPMMTNYADKLVQQKVNANSLQLPDAQAGSNINSKIESQLLADINQINKHFPKYNWISETYENRIIENSNYLLSLRYQVENIMAKPQITTRHKTFNLKNGQLLTKNDIFVANKDAELKKLVETKLKAKTAKLKLKPVDLSKMAAVCLQNYYVTSYGMVFCSDQSNDKLQPTVELSVSFKELKNVVKPEFLKEFGLK